MGGKEIEIEWRNNEFNVELIMKFVDWKIISGESIERERYGNNGWGRTRGRG